MSITSKYLEAAILDQMVAGAFPGKRYAFIKVLRRDNELGLGVAVANEPGYSPINQFFKDEATAKEWVDGLNEHIGLTTDEAARIVISTMGGRPYHHRATT